MKLLIFLLFPICLIAQTWTDPINISPNMPGLDNQPDLCIDKNGTLHCVFTHKLESNWRKIYYSKSTDDGLTWTTPEDISLNPDISLMNPHIVADTNNILYVTYDYNTGNPAATMVYIKTFDGNQWSVPLLVSENMLNSDNNLLKIDHNNRIYVFWFYQNNNLFYRYFENNAWSDTICPYPGNHTLMLLSVKIDDNNNIHCVGPFYSNETPQKFIYFSYIYDNYWTDKTFISAPTESGGGCDLDIDNQNNPHISWHQRTIGSPSLSDSTMYTFFNGSNWSAPELVVNDPYEQKIAIDPYNRVHIIDREKLETGTKLVHYQKTNGFWQGYIIDDSEIVVANPSLLEKDNILYLLYYKCYSDEDCRIQFTKNDLITNINSSRDFIYNIKIFPNPFKTETTIEFEAENPENINIAVYNLNGKQIITLKDEYFASGKYSLIWNGKDKNGKEVTTGLYLVRLQSGRNIITKPVEYINN